MHIAILHNDDADCLEHDPGREARADVQHVAAAMAAALESRRFQTRIVSAGADAVGFIEELRRHRPAAVVNLCESLAGDSRGEMAVPCLLDILGIPYTGSPALALGLALHKHKAKEVLRARGVSTPLFMLVERLEDLSAVELPFPLIVKPTREDASVGVDSDSVVNDRAGLGRAVERVLRLFAQPALVEQYIAGKEVYVPILGNTPRRTFPLTEIRFGAYFDTRPNIVTYKGKWDPRSPDYQNSGVGPAQLDALTEARCVRTAFAAFEALECRDYGRVDLRVTPAGEPYVIEVNPNCDLHPEAGFSNAARAAGLDYAMLANSLVEIALERSQHEQHRANPTHRAEGSGAALVPAEPHLRVHAG
jgi:D-alanine-D-alanine ligase